MICCNDQKFLRAVIRQRAVRQVEMQIFFLSHYCCLLVSTLNWGTHKKWATSPGCAEDFTKMHLNDTCLNKGTVTTFRGVQFSYALADNVSLGPSLHSQMRSTPLTSLDPIWGEGFIPVSIFAGLFGKLSLSSLVHVRPQAQTAITVKFEDICTDGIHNLHSNNVGNEDVLLWLCIYLFTLKRFILFQHTCSALPAVIKTHSKAVVFQIAFIDWGLDLLCLWRKTFP